METLVDVVREAFLILGADLTVISANPVFYKTFKSRPEETKNKSLYDLGNGQWDIPELRSLLSKVLPDKKIVKDYEVKHVFEEIGEKTILLNAKQIDSVQLIVLGLEDITERRNVESKLAEYTKGLEDLVADRTRELSKRVEELERVNKVMVGREMRMVELKRQLQALKKSQ